VVQLLAVAVEPMPASAVVNGTGTPAGVVCAEATQLHRKTTAVHAAERRRALTIVSTVPILMTS
jgi:hypothetical protein